MPRAFLTALLLATLLVPARAGQRSAAAARPADAALGAAIHQQDADGDAEGAIAAYKQFLVQYPDDRALAAQAQFRLGLAYEQLGRPEARQAYMDVVRHYPEQTTLGAQARRRITLLAPDAGASKLAARLVMSDHAADAAAVSPEGRWLAFSAESHGDLTMSDVTTGARRALVATACEDRPASCGYGQDAVFSADSSQVAYAWIKPGDDELRIVSTESSARPRVIMRAPEVTPTDWSPDGQFVLAVLTKTDSTDIVLVSTADGAVQIVKTLRGRPTLSRPRLSPDGKYIAFSSLPGNTREAQIYVVPITGSSEAQLTTENVNENPVWMPDGVHIAFVSNRTGVFALWAMTVRDGTRSGSPVLLKNDTGRILPVAMTRGGSLYYLQEQALGEGLNIFSVDIDARGKPSSPPKYLSERFAGLNCCAEWSPDGKSIAFKRRRVDNESLRDLVVRSLDSGTERTYVAPDWTNPRDGFGPGAPHWLRDGSGFFVGDEPIPGQARWLGRMRLDGQLVKLVEIPPQLGWVTALAPDDSTAYILTREDASPAAAATAIVAIDLPSGRQTSIFNAAAERRINSVVLSDDGRRLALFTFTDRGGRTTATLATIQSDGSGYRQIHQTTKRVDEVAQQIQWSKDGRTLFFLEDGQVMRIAAEGGVTEFTGLVRSSRDQAHGMSLSADGRRLAFTDGSPRAVSRELWVLDNVDSALQPRR
jgi:Tol biopolymer transport system component